MKKTVFFILSIIIFSAGGLFAVPACPDFEEIEQPDGKTFKAKLKGDEFYHWHEDEQGYTILKDTETKFWNYAKKHKYGHLEKSKYIVGKDFPSGIKRGLKDEDKLERARVHREHVFSQNRSSSLSENSDSVLQKAAAHSSASFSKNKTTNKKNLVILVAFSDKNFYFSPNDIENLYNKENYTYDGAKGSVVDYLKEISYNKCNIEFIVSTFVVTLDKSYKYYGENNSSGSDKHAQEMVKEAIIKLDNMGFDFAQADGDNDGYVDILTVIHAGCGEEYTGADSYDIWSHQWSMDSVYNTWDNKKLKEYITVPERRGSESSSIGLVRIGVIVHELMHVFGIPDLYDTTYKSKGLGSFCLMANGLWNGSNGTSPAHPCAWVKYKLGFINPKTLSKGKNSIETSSKFDTAFYIIAPESFNPREYFMIENRQPYGFDTKLPGNTYSERGLLIYHIDERKTNNNDRNHYLVALEEADATTSDWTDFDLAQNRNNGTSQDYFRDTTVTTFNDDNTISPNSKSYTGQKSGIKIFKVSASTDTMTFETENYDEFVDNLKDNDIEGKNGVDIVNIIMGFSKTKEELKSLTEDQQKELSKYFTFTKAGAIEANEMDGIYNEYLKGTVFGVGKDKMSSFSSIDANLVNKLNYALRTSSGTQTTKSVGVISKGNDAPIENNNISNGQNMRFTGTDAIENISEYLKEYGYLMPKLENMKLKSEYDIVEVLENTDMSKYKDYIFFAGEKTVFNYDLSKVVFYPNPARNGKITITNLPTSIDKLNIYIYTISGQMITSFSLDDTQVLGNGIRFFVWNCKTKSGNDIAQGVYMILIKTNNDKIVKKIAIIR